MRNTRSLAFSLMELLVCIGIIATLGVLLFPTMGNILAKAKQTTCVGNLRQLSMGFIAYRGEHNQCFPGAGLAQEANARWMQKVSPYLGLPDSTMANNEAYYQPVFYCPMVPPGVYKKGGTKAGCGVYGAPRTIVTLSSDLGVNYFSIKDPGKKVLLADKSFLSYQGYGGAGPGLDITAPFPAAADGTAANHRADHDPRKGPNGAANYLFCDGHVETLLAWPGVDAFNASK